MLSEQKNGSFYEEAGAAAAFRTKVALMNEFSTAWDMRKERPKHGQTETRFEIDSPSGVF